MLNEVRFDQMTQEELMAFWSRYHRPSRKDAAELCGGRFPRFTCVAATAASFACNLAVAMGCRRRGDERAAGIYQHAALLSWESLPEELRPRRPSSAERKSEPTPPDSDAVDDTATR